MVETIVSKLSDSELQYFFLRFGKDELKTILCLSETEFYRLKNEKGLNRVLST